MGTTVDPPPHRRPGIKSVRAGASDDETRASKSPESGEFTYTYTYTTASLETDIHSYLDLSSIPIDLEPLDSEVPQTPKKKSNKVVKTMVFDNQDGRCEFILLNYILSIGLTTVRVQFSDRLGS